jgi:transforming growth factor-beta-induced protein
MKTIKTFKNATRFALILAIGLFAVSCSEKEDLVMPEMAETNSGTIMDVLGAYDTTTPVNDYPEFEKSGRSPRPSFATLNVALARTGLAGVVSREQLTVFAPTDEAFAALGLNQRNIASVPNLKEILLYHVVAGMVYSNQLSNGYVPTLNGAAVNIMIDGGVKVNDANVIIADIKARNGVIHAIDQVLFPPTQNIVEIALDNEEFSILVDAVLAAGLAETLATGGPFTVFAPTNDAFVSLLGEFGWNGLGDIPAELLDRVLKYHVVSGRVFSTDLPAGPLEVTTIGGETFTIDVTIPGITDGEGREAGIIATDIQATNGVIHVINKVIVPAL